MNDLEKLGQEVNAKVKSLSVLLSWFTYRALPQ